MNLHLLPDLRTLGVQLTQRVREECAALDARLNVEQDGLREGVVVHWEDGPSLATIRPRLEALGTTTTTVTVGDLPPVVETTSLVRVGRSYSHRATALSGVLLAQAGLPSPPSVRGTDRFPGPWTPAVLDELETVDEYSFDTLYNFTTPLVDRMDSLLAELDLSGLPALPTGVDPALAGVVDVVERLSADAGTQDFSDMVLWMVSGGYELALSLAHPLASDPPLEVS